MQQVDNPLSETAVSALCPLRCGRSRPICVSPVSAFVFAYVRLWRCLSFDLLALRVRDAINGISKERLCKMRKNLEINVMIEKGASGRVGGHLECGFGARRSGRRVVLHPCRHEFVLYWAHKRKEKR